MKTIWHVSVDPLKHCFRWQFSFPMEFFQSHRETFSQKLYIILPYCFAKKPTFQFTYLRGTQRDYSSKPLKHSIAELILVFKR